MLKAYEGREPFLEQLRLLGDATRAASAAGYDKSSAYKARRSDPAFAQAWDEAIASAPKAKKGRPAKPASEPKAKKARRSRAKVWAPEPHQIDFLDTLASTGIPQHAAHQTKFSLAQMRAQREHSPGFRGAWDDAQQNAAAARDEVRWAEVRDQYLDGLREDVARFWGPAAAEERVSALFGQAEKYAEEKAAQYGRPKALIAASFICSACTNEPELLEEEQKKLAGPVHVFEVSKDGRWFYRASENPAFGRAWNDKLQREYDDLI